jgi:hypothetical protein
MWPSLFSEVPQLLSRAAVPVSLSSLPVPNFLWTMKESLRRDRPWTIRQSAALPHAPLADDAKLLRFDTRANGRFYKSDLTRVLTSHTISTKLQTVYAVVLQAQDAALRAIRPGVKAGAADAEARAVIAQTGFGDFFDHGLGHGIGLSI